MAETERIRYISFLQILGVVLVILGHSLQEYPGIYQRFWLYCLFRTVRMPLFTFISGFLFMISMIKKGDSISLRGFVCNKTQRLLLPYFFLLTVTFLPRALMSCYANNFVEINFKSFFDALTISNKLSIVFLWYLPMIFMVLCLAFIGYKIFRKHIIAFFICGGLLSLYGYFFLDQWACKFLAIGRIAGLSVFFILGTVYGYYRREIDAWLGRCWVGVLSAVVWLGLFLADDIPTVLDFVCSVAGLAMLISFSLNVCDMKLGWYHLDGYNYMMYLLSWFTCSASQQVLSHFTDFPWWVYTCISLITSIYIPWAIGKTLHACAPRSRFARALLFLLGHNPNKGRKPVMSVVK
jgi:hypothetical protein